MNIKKIVIVMVCMCSTLLVFSQSQIGSFISGGITRDYKLYLPLGYTPSTNYPLVLNLHGYMSNALQQELYSGMNTIADSNSFIVVYPEGIADSSGNQAWNSGLGSSIDDVGFLSALIDTLAASYSIDTTRVFSCGMSNGGFMSHHLACHLSHKIAAIASVTGSMTLSTYASCNPQRAVPVLQIAGASDPVIDFNGDPGALFGYKSMETVVNFWVNHNNISSGAIYYAYPDSSLTDSCTAEQYTYQFGDDSSEVVLVKIINGGHTWPGSFHLGTLGPTNLDFSASELIWDFFSKFELTEVSTAIADPTSSKVRFYPNPFNQSITIDGFKDITGISLYNLLGKKVISQNTVEPTTTIATSNLKPGIYFLHINTKNNQQIFRIIKQN